MRHSLSAAILPLAVAETLLWAALYYGFPALLPAWEADFGWSRDEVTGAFTASLVVMALGAPRAGRLIDRGYATPMFLGAIAVAALLLVLLTQVDQLWQFWAVWIAIGAVNACILYEACFAIITVITGPRAREGITLVTLVAGFATAVSFPFYFGLTESFGWRAAVLVFAGITVAVSLPLAWLSLRALEHHREPAAERPVTTGDEGRRALTNPAFWGLSVAFGSVGLIHGMLYTHIRPILGDAGLASATAIAVASMMGPMQVVGRLVIVSLGARVDAFGIGVGAFCGMGLGVGALIAAGVAPWLAMAFVVPYGASWGAMSIVRPVLTAEFLGRAGFGVISGLIAVPFVMGSATGPVLAAWIWAAAGYGPVLWLAMCLAGVSLVAVFLARRTVTSPA
ncbi:MAG: MFS transporter [Pseudomonadota bacterium]